MPSAQMAKDLEIFYTIEGTGPQTLLFIHGWACDSQDWLLQTTHFSTAYQVVAADNRGHGHSSVTESGYDVLTLAHDLKKLLDVLGIERVIPVGHSLGGLIASAFAVEYPDRVDAVICIDPAYGLAPAEVAAFAPVVDQLAAQNDHEVTEAVMASLDGPTTPVFFAAWHARRAAGTDRRVVVEAAKSFSIAPEALGPRDRSEAYLARRTCPALTIWSGHHEERAIWERTLPGRNPYSSAIHVPLAHWPHHDAPTMINMSIEHWLRGLPPHQ